MNVQRSAFVSPRDDDLVPLSIAARLLVFHVHSNRYIDPNEPLGEELEETARTIARFVSLYRVTKNDPGTGRAGPDMPTSQPVDLHEWAIRRGDLRTALQRLIVHR